MECLLIFDHLNDIVYAKYNSLFEKHISDFASKADLVTTEQNNEGTSPTPRQLDENVIVQLFSPIITSHRIMNCQFGNAYTSIQCPDGLAIYFDEFMGYLFVHIGTAPQMDMKKSLNMAVTLVRYLCGPDVELLKNAENGKAVLLSRLLDSWHALYRQDQAIFVEAVEQVILNPDLSNSLIQILKESVEKLTSTLDCDKMHALLLVNRKFLALYSSQNAKELSPADILFVTVLTHQLEADGRACDVLLGGPQATPKCLPHVVHAHPLSDGLQLVYLLEKGNASVAASLYETFCHLHTLQLVQIQRDKDTLQTALDNLDVATKRLNDSLKKNKNQQIDSCHKQLLKKWEIIRKKYQEFVKSGSDEALLRAETLVLGFLENLKQLLAVTHVEVGQNDGGRAVKEAVGVVKDKLTVYGDFFHAKSDKNFTLGSRTSSLTMKKYLEEFPGLVHFLYIDRSSHRVTMPTLVNFTEENDGKFTTAKIWNMVNFARNHLQEGNFSLMWKDTTFNYAYFLWFEDSNGAALKPHVFPSAATTSTAVGKSNTQMPGILGEDYYHKLKENLFPKLAPNKIKCYELYCVHLGLITASCVLEQTRRLSATIWEIIGHPNHPIDLL